MAKPAHTAAAFHWLPPPSGIDTANTMATTASRPHQVDAEPEAADPDDGACAAG